MSGAEPGLTTKTRMDGYGSTPGRCQILGRRSSSRPAPLRILRSVPALRYWIDFYVFEFAGLRLTLEDAWLDE